MAERVGFEPTVYDQFFWFFFPLYIFISFLWLIKVSNIPPGNYGH